MKILGISGSLREGSSNGAVLKAYARRLPEGVAMTEWKGLGDLPPFDPGLDLDPSYAQAPEPVRAFRMALAEADALIISTPEYAFGMPGVLKNALDWTVSMAVMERLPVVAVSASPTPSGGAKAHQGLLWVLTALGMDICEEGSLQIAQVRKRIGSEGELLDPSLAERIDRGLEALRQASRKAALPG